MKYLMFLFIFYALLRVDVPAPIDPPSFNGQRVATAPVVRGED